MAPFRCFCFAQHGKFNKNYTFSWQLQNILCAKSWQTYRNVVMVTWQMYECSSLQHGEFLKCIYTSQITNLESFFYFLHDDKFTKTVLSHMANLQIVVS